MSFSIPDPDIDRPLSTPSHRRHMPIVPVSRPRPQRVDTVTKTLVRELDEDFADSSSDTSSRKQHDTHREVKIVQRQHCELKEYQRELARDIDLKL